MSPHPEPDQEILAITTVHAALKDLETAAQIRVVEYVLKKLDLKVDVSKRNSEREPDEAPTPPPDAGETTRAEFRKDSSGDEFSGVSPVAQKWIQRNGLRADQLNSIFSLGGDEIDLISSKVLGKSTRARMRSVFLLKGVAAYLAGGAPRFAYEKVKEACLHYRAYDKQNFNRDVKALAAEVTGSTESGYSLTPRGLASAVDLLKQMLKSKPIE